MKRILFLLLIVASFTLLMAGTPPPQFKGVGDGITNNTLATGDSLLFVIGTDTFRVLDGNIYKMTTHADSALATIGRVNAQIASDPFYLGDIEFTGHNKQWMFIHDIDITYAHIDSNTRELGITELRMDGNAADSAGGSQPPYESEPDSNQVIHPSVVYIPDGLYGYKYWMAATPYPNTLAYWENIIIRASNDGIIWDVPVIQDGGAQSPDDPLTTFTDAVYDDEGESSIHLSDPDLVLGKNGLLYIVYRSTYGGGVADNLFWMSTDDGYTFTTPVKMIDGTLAYSLSEDANFLSPAMVLDTNGRMLCFTIEEVNVFDNEIVRWDADSIPATWGIQVEKQISVVWQMGYDTPKDTTGREFWHIGVTSYGVDNLVMLAAMTTNGSTAGASTRLQIAASRDGGANWELNDNLFIKQTAFDNNRQYRATGVFVYDAHHGLAMDMWMSGAETGSPIEWATGYARIFFNDTNNIWIDTGDVDNLVEPGKFIMQGSQTIELDYDVNQGDLKKDTLRYHLAPYWVDFDMVHGNIYSAGDDITLSLPVTNSAGDEPLLFINSAGDITPTVDDTVTISGFIPFGGFMDSLQICYEWNTDDISEIIDVFVMGMDKSNGYASIDSIYFTDATDLGSVGWDTAGYSFNDSLETVLSGDRFTVKFHINFDADFDSLRVAWIRARVVPR